MTYVISFALFLLGLPKASCMAVSKKKIRDSSAGAGFGASSTKKMYQPDESESTQRLLHFLKSQKSSIDSVQVGLDPANSNRRGLYAAKQIAKAEKIICKIPSDCALALSDPAKQLAGEDDTPTLAHAGANFLRMYVKNDQAKRLWSPYLDTLPDPTDKEFIENTTPDYFTDEEIDLLEFPRLKEKALQRKKDLQSVSQESNIPLDELQYATYLVSSRSFPIQLATEDEKDPDFGGVNDETRVLRDDRGQVITKVVDEADKKYVRVMVPLLDMANHKSTGEANAKLTILDPEKDDAWFALEALRPIPQGKEITISYGSGIDSSVELLLNYGFVPIEGNRVDAFMLKKGGDDAITSLDGWTTTLEEDKTMLNLLDSEEDGSSESLHLRKILSFRIRLKEAYGEIPQT